MPILLYALGAICLVGGLVVAWLGFPEREFSFGNTLILTGAMTAVGGLILIGLGAVVSHLQQLIDAGLAHAAPPQRPLESFEAAPMSRPPAGRIPFPPKPKAEPRPAAAMPVELPAKTEPIAGLAPTLPNPEEQPPVTVAEEVSLSPPQPAVEPGALGETREEPVAETEPKEGFDKDWPAAPPIADRRSSFGFKWPGERKADEPTVAKEAPAAPTPAAEPAPEPERIRPTEPLQSAERPRDVAVLKSGVVDGMGYTLYVDGSIEAELPQGTLRFASINELRQHLEQNT